MTRFLENSSNKKHAQSLAEYALLLCLLITVVLLSLFGLGKEFKNIYNNIDTSLKKDCSNNPSLCGEAPPGGGFGAGGSGN